MHALARPVAALAAALLLSVAGCATPPKTAQTPAVPDPQAEEVGVAATFADALEMHRVPWRPPLVGKAILVNIPSYELIAFEDGEPVIRSRVVVGRDVRGDRTPTIDTQTSVVRYRPTWRPTPMMIERGDYEDKVWPPGPKNPLGLLAIRLEPGMLIYLHGTNKPWLFDKDSRALSGGCIRVEKWDELAAWVQGVSVEEVTLHANGRRTFDAPTEHVPVHIRYFTEFPDEGGRMALHEDPYGFTRRAEAPPASPTLAETQPDGISG
jgi:murein L,D-transpeptidase YcbB/YkuD